METKLKGPIIFLILVCFYLNSLGFNGTIKFSDDFYAAQKYFYNEAKAKFPKITSEKFYPEVPIKGTATADELKKITALTDLFEARQKFLEEVKLYPEQIYTEIFSFLNGHPGLTVNASNKPKFAALEKYFHPFFYIFSADKHYSFDKDIKVNPCPIVFCMKDEKKNAVSFTIYNTSKKTLSFIATESPGLGYITVTNKKPIPLGSGGNSTIKLTVDLQKLKKDSVFRVVNLSFYDPTQPKLKLIVPIILLPSKDFLSLPPHFYDFTFSYSTFFKHISLQKEKASWPEACPGNDCSGKKQYSLRSPERLTSSYNFGDLCTIQYYVNTTANPGFNSKSNSFKFSYNELGNIAGADRFCPGAEPGSEVHCPPETPNNGKELYGSRKIEFKLFLPPGKSHELRINLNYSDLLNQPQVNSELSWLQDKKLFVVITDNAQKQVAKEYVTKNPFSVPSQALAPGTYTIAIFPVTEDGKQSPSFNMQHLNHGSKSRFDFTLNGTVILTSSLQLKK